MKTYKRNGYTLKMQNTGNTDSYGKFIIRYKFTAPDGATIFEGSDLHASPMHAPEGKESAGALLSFLTAREGDVESEYFENYTPRQIEFRDNEAEDLQLWAMELSGEL